MPGWHRGLRLVSLLVARAPGTRPYRAIDAAGLREALRQTAEERHGMTLLTLRGLQLRRSFNQTPQHRFDIR